MGVENDPHRPATPECCAPVDPSIARHFDRRMRERQADDPLPPLHDVSRRLLDAMRHEAPSATSILEIGCGAGALTVALLERGAASATGVDLSPESIDVARRRASAAGLSERAHFTTGDGASLHHEPHDWVVLDRVVCCYPDLDALLRNAVGAARRRVAFSVPISDGWRGILNRIRVGLEALGAPLRGCPCRGYVHDVRHIESRLRQAGFRRTTGSVARLWYVAVFDR